MYVVPNPSNEEQPSDLEETINDYNYNNPNDSQNFIPEQYEVFIWFLLYKLLLTRSSHIYVFHFRMITLKISTKVQFMMYMKLLIKVFSKEII